MNIVTRWRAAAAGVLAACVALALSACIVSPGKFEATLDLRRDGTFTFTYDGEIYLLALSQLAEMANSAEAASEEFVESPCFDDDTWEERACTAEEIAEQRDFWEQEVQSRKASAERDAQMMSALLGGIDPADPAAAEELAERLRRQAGWESVEYSGGGRFDVRFSLTSRMGHDFAFPTFERLAMSNPFLVASLRKGNAVRIEAPGFAAEGGGNAMQGSMTGLAVMAQAASSEAGSDAPELPEMQGTFRIVTDGRILANNTDEGPQAGAGGQVLQWRINRRTQAAPMALIELDR